MKYTAVLVVLSDDSPKSDRLVSQETFRFDRARMAVNALRTKLCTPSGLPVSSPFHSCHSRLSCGLTGSMVAWAMK